MKIERRPTNLTPFEDIFSGVVFKDEDGAICMKLEKEQNNFYNAVNLNTGSLYTYKDGCLVEILEDAVLTY